MTIAVSREMAEAEFGRFCEAMALEFDVEKMDPEDAKKFSDLRETFVSAVERGHVTVNDAGEPTLHMQMPVELQGKTWSSLHFAEPSGETFKAFDGKGKDSEQRKAQAIIAKLCGVSEPVIAAMKQRDLRVAQAIFVLFLA